MFSAYDDLDVQVDKPTLTGWFVANEKLRIPPTVFEGKSKRVCKEEEKQGNGTMIGCMYSAHPGKDRVSFKGCFSST